MNSIPDDERQHMKILRDLLMEADAVVCSRAIPKVKAKLVRMVRSYNKVVLAIGDGANDVNMLMVAPGESGSGSSYSAPAMEDRAPSEPVAAKKVKPRVEEEISIDDIPF